MIASLSVLVVDDDPSIVALIRALIEDVGGDVWATFASGEDALAAFGEAAAAAAGFTGGVAVGRSDAVLTGLPDIALLDLNLPGIDGIELARRLHALVPTMRMVLVSSDDRGDLPSDALIGGADEFVAKEELGPERIRQLLGA